MKIKEYLDDPINEIADRQIFINERDKSGKNALDFAGMLGREDVIRVLIECGADPNSCAKRGLLSTIWFDICNKQTFLSISFVNMALGSVVNKLCSILLLGSDINRDANPVSFPSRAETSGGVWGVIHPSHSSESSPRRAKDSKSSGQFLQIRTT